MSWWCVLFSPFNTDALIKLLSGEVRGHWSLALAVNSWVGSEGARRAAAAALICIGLVLWSINFWLSNRFPTAIIASLSAVELSWSHQLKLALVSGLNWQKEIWLWCGWAINRGHVDRLLYRLAACSTAISTEKESWTQLCHIAGHPSEAWSMWWRRWR